MKHKWIPRKRPYVTKEGDVKHVRCERCGVVRITCQDGHRPLEQLNKAAKNQSNKPQDLCDLPNRPAMVVTAYLVRVLSSPPTPPVVTALVGRLQI